MQLIDKLIRRSVRSRTTLPLKEYVGKKLREVYYNAEVLYRIESKIEPLNIRLDNGSPQRINLLLPEINFDSFYGGYMAKLHLARKLVEVGYRVRLVVVDPCAHTPKKWRGAVRYYPGLESIFDRVEVAYQGDRQQTLEVSPSDRFIATTWWTAYLAHNATDLVKGPPFVYLIQEYEPFTFPMGSYYAMAEQSYSFPHHALFSSALLQEFFRRKGIGVYDEGRGDEHADYFENAIVSFGPDELDGTLHARGGGEKRLLFYARPEAHATRNMFEVAFLGLSRAIKNGVFEDHWEFHGIGSRHGDIDLPKGNTLTMLGKLSLSDYRRALLQYDLGLSLMYTPHPSLLPLDMAAAGMVVVTNTCLNKTTERLQELSGNLIGADPCIDGVHEGLCKARELADDLPHRRAGSRVNWADNWNDTFHDGIMSSLESRLA
ncbi:MAG: hypothetical protein MAG794_01122 [Gammaproteobacteria bacterium]|nr:hypothetical protein [Gammaproteobacteria bacterium]